MVGGLVGCLVGWSVASWLVGCFPRLRADYNLLAMNNLRMRVVIP